MMATVPHVTSGLGLKKFQADGFLLTRKKCTITSGERSVYIFRRVNILSCMLKQQDPPKRRQ